MSEDARVLRVEGLANARDLGGMGRAVGGITPYGVFYRSESLDRVTVDGWEQLRAKGVRTVVDLRTPIERARDEQPRPDWLSVVPVDLDGSQQNREFWSAYEDSGLDGTPLVLRPQVEAMPGRVAAVLTAIATAAAGGVLFHCMGGRDRTGLIALILLGIAGVPRELVAEDYLRTASAGREFDLTATADGEVLRVGELLARYETTPRRAILEAIDGIDPPALVNRLDLPAPVRRALIGWRGRLTS